MKLTLKEALQQMMDFNPETHGLWHRISNTLVACAIEETEPSFLMDGTFEIRPKIIVPVKKTRPMNYAEIRELVLQRAWFKNSRNACFTVSFNDMEKEIAGSPLTDLLDYGWTYSLDGRGPWLPLTVEE